MGDSGMRYEEILDKADDSLFIIAEAGVNHNGNIKTAFELVDAAVEAGCDAVKFQTWVTEKVYSRDKSIKPEYQELTTSPEETEYETIKNLELTYDQFIELKKYCSKKGILFFSTPDEEESANFLLNMGVDVVKTASQDVTNTPFLSYVAQLGIPIVYSTGACTISELTKGVETIKEHNEELIILHCVSSYPAPAGQLNLSFIPILKKMFNFPVGLSDHTVGTEAACVAIALGARVLEKHLTLDRSLKGPDHQASLEPDEMNRYCRSARNALESLGDGIKKIMPCEQDTRRAFRRYIVSAHRMTAGRVITGSDILYKKVVDGIAPQQSELIIGSTLTRDIPEDTVIKWDMLKIR
jgi:N,N'-diacetyllegionaminate synthase